MLYEVITVNKRLVQDIEEHNLFITMFYSEIDLDEACFRWVHAGHESALHYDPVKDVFATLGGEGVPRITSYNVCYTNLLRTRHRREAVGASVPHKGPVIITMEFSGDRGSTVGSTASWKYLVRNNFV